MKPHKLLNRWIDLDHVLAVSDIEIELFDGHKMYFKVDLAFRDTPIEVIYQPEGEHEFISKFYKQHPEIQRDEDYIESTTAWYNHIKPDFQKIHDGFIENWKDATEPFKPIEYTPEQKQRDMEKWIYYHKQALPELYKKK
jgi:hypothetical protein